MRILQRAAVIAGLALTSAPVRAHHATAAEFDVNRLILLHGTVRKIEWINPHAWLYLDVQDTGGQVATWRIEGASMNAYEVRKFPKESLTPGVEVSITVYPSKNGERVADGATITFPDGKRIFFGGSAPIDGVDREGKPCKRNARDPGCQ